MDIQIIAGLLTTLHQLRQRDRWTRQHLETHQSRSLHLLRAYAYARSPFYQQFHRGLADRPLHELPVLTKAMMMENFDALVTDRAICREAIEAHLAGAEAHRRFLGRYWINATSGSSGRPGLFLFDRNEWTAILAAFARAYEWAGIWLSLTRRRKMAVVASTTPWHMSAQVGATVHTWWTPTLSLAATEPLETIVRQLNAWQPETLVAYASMVGLLADEQRAGRLHIAPAPVFTSSEVLTEETRRRVEAAWGKTLFNQYAATEGGSLAAECAQHQGMHLAEDMVIFEVVDQDNRPVPPGMFGDKALLTVLFSRTQPLIRYELSDRVRLAAAPCPCGRPYALIDAVQGRVEEVLTFPAIAGGEVTVHPNVFHQVMDIVPAREWRVVQERDGVKVLLSGVQEGFADVTLADALRRALAAQGVRVSGIEVQRVAALPRTAAGKSPLIQSNAHCTTTASGAP